MARATTIDGRAVAATLVAQVKAEVDRLKSGSGRPPGLAVVIVGTDPASQVYVASKGRMAEACGFKSVQHTLPSETTEADLLDLVDRLNRDTTIDGILVQLPLPKHVDTLSVIGAIAPHKDVDGFTEINAGRVAVGALDNAFVPCTPAGSMLLIRSVLGEDLSGKHAVVIGRSNIVGKPMASLLLAANCTVTIAHSRTADLPGVCRLGDILVAAAGRPEMVRGGWIKPGAVVIDVGINRVPDRARGDARTRLVGDVAFDEAAGLASAITPVPGGVGPMTIAMLMTNTLRSARRSLGAEPGSPPSEQRQDQPT